MKVFVDTNILIELFENRKEADNIECIFEYIEQQNWERFLSVGSFYTLTFLLERILRHQRLTNPHCLTRLREILEKILQTFQIASTSKAEFTKGVQNTSFKDLEDSYQYETALSADCKILLTINVKDFRMADQSNIQILSPEDFIKEYNL